MYTSAQLERLGALVKDQRERKRIYTAKAAAGIAGISAETWGKVERGLPVGEVTYRIVEDVLGWTAGSCELILGGGEPSPLASALAPVPAADAANPYTDPAEREIWNITELPEGERRAYIELLRERRRAAG